MNNRRKLIPFFATSYSVNMIIVEAESNIHTYYKICKAAQGEIDWLSLILPECFPIRRIICFIFILGILKWLLKNIWIVSDFQSSRNFKDLLKIIDSQDGFLKI